MGWPLLVDSLNLLGVSAVPITLFLDESGVIKAVNPRPEELETFVAQEPAGTHQDPWIPPTPSALLAQATGDDLVRASQLYLWGGQEGVSAAIHTFERITQQHPNHAEAQFRLGVAYRSRFDSNGQRPDDFNNAVKQWGIALELNPNQYIWRRRIQQYGPRLAKPYSFYDWVHEARSDLEEAGLQPINLSVEPGGAEFAYPSTEFEVVGQESKNPDPNGRIFRDSKRLVSIETVAVPAKVRGGEAVRVHVRLDPDRERLVHWNNEVEDLLVWVDAPPSWQLEQPLHQIARPEKPVSSERRNIEFEVRVPKEVQAGEHRLRGFALYYICEDVGGLCLYRRQDFEATVQVAN